MTAKPRMLLCFCGCGQPVLNADRKFLQGHNSRRTVRSPAHTPYPKGWAQAFRKHGGKLAFLKSGEVLAKSPDGTLLQFESCTDAEESLADLIKELLRHG